MMVLGSMTRINYYMLRIFFIFLRTGLCARQIQTKATPRNTVSMKAVPSSVASDGIDTLYETTHGWNSEP